LAKTSREKAQLEGKRRLREKKRQTLGGGEPRSKNTRNPPLRNFPFATLPIDRRIPGNSGRPSRETEPARFLEKGGGNRERRSSKKIVRKEHKPGEAWVKRGKRGAFRFLQQRGRVWEKPRTWRLQKKVVKTP